MKRLFWAALSLLALVAVGVVAFFGAASTMRTRVQARRPRGIHVLLALAMVTMLGEKVTVKWW